MSTRIKILPDQLTNKIAAGEVVERPASVLKELVENSLDSGCSEVVVEIESGGKRLIKVSDNGCGMSREDALLALERHATSKIASDSDLFNLTTLGFRGEALPSIASVSRFTLATRERGRMEGTEIYVEGGRIKEVKACGMAEGTVVSVRNLFFNTPARLKFMKSVETESGHVGDILTKLAMSRPDTRFTFVNEGRNVFRTLNGDLKSRVSTLLGKALAANLYQVEFAEEQITVKGLVANPECNRSAPTSVYTFVNGRFIRDRVVQHAILQSYRNFLEKGRYPVVVLFIDIPAGEVDVNVHPTKHEVRFREQGRVHDIIQAAVESVLRATPWIQVSRASASPFVLPGAASAASEARVAEVKEALTNYRPVAPTPRPFFQSPSSARPEAAFTTIEKEVDDNRETGYFTSLTIIGQFNAAYVLCQDGADLVLVDQHAAHERIAFERLKKQFANDSVESQGLLFPEPTEFLHGEMATLRENLKNLVQLGYELEEFGGTTWLIKGVPRLLAGANYLRTLRDIVEELQGLGKSKTFNDALEDILARIACHSVVRGTHPLTGQEISALLKQMDATDFSSNCPHGRPVFRKISLDEIERMFRRQ